MKVIEMAEFGEAFVTGPYALYDELRAMAKPCQALHHDGSHRMWLLTRYADVASILKDARITKKPSGASNAEGAYRHNLLAQDPPDHGRLRALAFRAFTPERVKSLESRVHVLSNELLDRVAGSGGMEFMDDFARRLPAIVISELMGVPAHDRETFRYWSQGVLTGLDASRPRYREHETCAGSLSRYFFQLIEQRRQQPRDDLISALTQVSDNGDRLSESELLALCMLLLIAGHETTVNLLGNGLYTLLAHPEQRKLVEQSPELMSSAVEEMLRFESPVQRATFRMTTDDILIGGTLIPRGDQVSAVIGAANRDPQEFKDPSLFDVTRRPNRHLAFGSGIHFCLGPALARMEARVALSLLLERMPRVRLAHSSPSWSGDATAVRGLRHLRLQF